MTCSSVVIMVACLQGALAHSANATQPSFDCGKARAWSEIEVCRDDGLASLDATLASLYRAQKARLDQRRQNALIIDQRQWLAERDNCRFTPSGSRCLTEIYKRRIAELSSSPGLDAGSNSQTAGVPPGPASALPAEVSPHAGEADGLHSTGRYTASGQSSRGDEKAKFKAADVDAPQSEARSETREFLEGKGAYDRGDFTTALRLFQAAAEHGDAAAQRTLGDMYYRGVGVAEDKQKALQWIRISAEQNDMEAQLSLGRYLCQIRSTEAEKWLRKAADQGSMAAKKDVGQSILIWADLLKY